VVDGTCTDRKKELAKSAIDATSPAKVWYDEDTRRIDTGCRAFTTGSSIATLDEPVMPAMLAVRDDK
jgi:hypothetical protein